MAKNIIAKFKNRADTSTNWASNNPVLEVGELGLETDTTKIKFGDGATSWNKLAYYSHVSASEKELWNNKANMSDFPTSLPANGGNATTAKCLVGDDTRAIDSPPSEYMNGGNRYAGKAGWQTEFKNTSTLGLSKFLAGNYCYLETKNPWSDASGGYPIQIVYGNGTPVWRVGISNTVWSTWKSFSDDVAIDGGTF